jgi:hypothetical protein
MYTIITQGLAHVHHTITSLTPEQAAGLVSAACAAGGLLLQYLNYRRGKAER